MILNGGIDPNTNATIIPSAQFDVITSAHSIVTPYPNAEESAVVYGLGWFRETFIGHDVSENWVFFGTFNNDASLTDSISHRRRTGSVNIHCCCPR